MSNHFKVSLVKSFVRFGAGIFLINGMLVSSGVLFIFAEFLGIVEELFE